MFFVLNERAGHGKGLRTFNRLRQLLGPEDVVAVTRGGGDGRRIAAEAGAAGHDLVVAVGGDGTVNEVVNGLAEAGFGPALGILPAGGANDLCYALGIPARPELALALLRSGARRALDVGLVRFSDGRRQYFLNVMGMGVSGEIAALTRADRRWPGPYAYLFPLLLRMFQARPRRFQVRVGEEVLFRRAQVAHLANGRREGRVFTVAPEARMDDGLLDLLAIEDAPLLQRPFYALRSLRGRPLAGPGVIQRRVKAAVVRAEDPLPCHIDGEPLTLGGGEEAEAEVLPGRLSVAAP